MISRCVIDDILIDLVDAGLKYEIKSDPISLSLTITSGKKNGSDFFGYLDIKYPIKHLINFMESEGYKFNNQPVLDFERVRKVEINFKKSTLMLLKSKSKNG